MYIYIYTKLNAFGLSVTFSILLCMNIYTLANNIHGPSMPLARNQFKNILRTGSRKMLITFSAYKNLYARVVRKM